MVTGGWSGIGAAIEAPHRGPIGDVQGNGTAARDAVHMGPGGLQAIPAVTARMLRPGDVAEAAMFVLSLPARAWVPELTILPTALQALGKTSQTNLELPGV